LNNPNSFQFPSIVDEISNHLPEDIDLYLVGGAIRDHFLDRDSTDFDFTVSNGAIRFARKIADALHGDFFVLDVERDAARVLLPNKKIVLDFVGKKDGNIISDLQGRDFTINAMGVQLNAERKFFDPCKGLPDLQKRSLRMCKPDAIAKDPIRALRAIRLAAQFGLIIQSDTSKEIRQASKHLYQSSNERIRDEFVRLLMLPNPEGNLRTLEAVSILDEIIPEIKSLKELEQSPPHVFTVWEHTLKSIGRAEKILGLLQRDYPAEGAQDLFGGMIVLSLGRFRDPISDLLGKQPTAGRPRWAQLLLALLLHDAGKGVTQQIAADRIRYPDHEEASAELASDWLERMKFSRTEIVSISKLISAHKLVTKYSRQNTTLAPLSIYRYFREMGDLGIDLGLHSLADLMGRWGIELPEAVLSARLNIIRSLFEGYFEQFNEVIDPPTLLDGSAILAETKHKSGPQIGNILELIREAQVEGKIQSRAEALALAKAHN
jgi:poly(A) polymerase